MLHVVYVQVLHVMLICSYRRRADQLIAEDNDDTIPYCIATGDIKKLVTFFTGRGQLLEALIIAQVQGGRGYRNWWSSSSFLKGWMNGINGSRWIHEEGGVDK